MATTAAGDTELRWVDGKSHVNEANLRADAATDFFAGVGLYTHLKVTQKAAGANMSVDVAPGHACIRTAAGVAYRIVNLATKNVDLSAVPGGSDKRIDLVLLEARDDGTNDDWRIKTLAGTPNPSPVQPATPDGCLLLATVLLTSTTPSVTDAIVTDKRQPMHRVAIMGDHPQYKYGGGAQPGQALVDYETGKIHTRADGDGPLDLYSVTAGFLRLRAFGGEPVLGDAPDNAQVADILVQLVTQAVAFNSAGNGRLILPVEFPNAILGFVTLGSSNTGGVIYSRRTSGTPPELGEIILEAVFVSPTAGVGLITDTRNVTALVIGW